MPGEALINVTEWHSSILCFYTCAGVRKTVSADLIAYSALEQPVLEPVPWMEEGASHNLTCKVPAVAPARNLTVTLGRGAETLRAGTFEHDADLSPHQVQVTQRITARRRHHGQNVTCQAELSLEPHGPRLSSAAAPAALAVYGEPLPAVNETANATCTIRTFFPEARFALSLDGQPLPASVSEEGHRAVAELALPRPGAFEVLCTGSVGPQERQARATVHVHSECRQRVRGGRGQRRVLRSAPRAGTLGPDAWAPGGDGGPGHPGPGWRWRWVCPGSADPPPLPADGPRMDEAGCPQQQTWTEGREAALRCSARGNPPPHVECARDGRPFPVAQPQPAARAHAGTYRCRAANRLGDAGHYEFPVLPAVLVTMAVLAFACAAGVGYGFYHHKKKIRRYKLQERQRQMEMQPMVGRSPEAAAPNGSAPAAGP
uniref:Intercellular adhesion molecule 1/3/5 D2 domain-containing protein n=1 Tax=Dromaius novaehollandiae TaxID=8790 RepID=A0A8C4J5D9_DRONO